jgi:hypothetical protein
MNIGEEMITTKDCKLLMVTFQLVDISSRNRVPSGRGVFNL